MEHNIAAVDLLPGDEVEGFYVLSDAQIRTTAAGKAFLTGTLSDASGSVSCKLWDYNGTLHETAVGQIVNVRGDVIEFKGAPQFNITRIRVADEKDNYDLADLVPTAPIDIDAMMQDVVGFVDSMEDEDYKRVCQAMLEKHKEAFRTIPAAKSVHHAFLSGLLMHTGNMMHLADFLAYQYHYVVNRSLLLAGTLLHDFAKEQEFLFSKLGLVTDYSIKGDLLGHLVMGAQEVAKVADELGIPEDKSLLLQHMILSHHGLPERGAAVIPVCAESELLSYIDGIDSRMEIYAETFESVPVGKFSPKVFALEKRIFHHE